MSARVEYAVALAVKVVEEFGKIRDDLRSSAPNTNKFYDENPDTVKGYLDSLNAFFKFAATEFGLPSKEEGREMFLKYAGPGVDVNCVYEINENLVPVFLAWHLIRTERIIFNGYGVSHWDDFTKKYKKIIIG